MSRSGSSFGVVLLASGLVLLASGWAAAVETVTIGDGGQLDWLGEGTVPLTTIDAIHRSPIDPDALLVGNVPGNLLDFESERSPNSLHLLEFQEGANIAPGTMARGGWVDAPNVFAGTSGMGSSGWTGGLDKADIVLMLQEVLDDEGDDGELKAFERPAGSAFGILVILDLGGRFGVDRIRWFPRNTVQPSPTTPFQEDYIRAFELFSNDGINLTKGGNPIWEPLLVEEDNKSAVVEVEVDPPRVIRHIRIRSITSLAWEIDEIQVFARGFLTTGQYISDIFDAGEPAAWSNLSWAEEIVGALPELSGMEIRTRTGTDEDPYVFTRTLMGKLDPDEIPYAVDSLTEEMDWAQYQALPSSDSLHRDWEPGPIKDDLVNWSPFSSPYPEDGSAGTAIISPSPRRYFQFLVNFRSSSLGAARVLKSLSFDYATPPLADSLRAEIFPRRVEVSRSMEFTYAVQAIMKTGGLTGFDTIEIPTAARVESINAIELWDGDGQLMESREDFPGLEDPAPVNGFQIEEVTDRHFVLRFPRVHQNRTLLKIRFQTEVLGYSTDFAGSVRLADEPEAFQAVTSANAASLGEGDEPSVSGTTVLSPEMLEGDELLGKVQLTPNPFTPNGDGVNDRLLLSYNVLALSEARPVEITVHDLSGRRVRLLHSDPEPSGRYEDKTWDGSDDQGQLLPPGLYIVRLSVRGDAAEAEQSRVIALAY